MRVFLFKKIITQRVCLKATADLPSIERLKNITRCTGASSQTGFTLIETLVGVVLLANIVIGPVVFLTTGFTHIKTAEDRLTALYLAQEGIELVRALRDQNALNGNPDWRAGLAAGTYQMDFDDAGLSMYGGQPLLYNNANGRYSHNIGEGTASKFYRQIQISDISGFPNGFLATIFVQWIDGTVTKTIQLSLELDNWL